MVQPDIEEMFSKLRQIRCAWCPRLSVYDKVSKTQIYIDTELGNMSRANNLAWRTRQKIGFYGEFSPQVKFTNEWADTKTVLDYALTVARNGEIAKHILKAGIRHESYGNFPDMLPDIVKVE